MKLKTLNDLWKELENETYEDTIPHPDSIKEEAIEWIKRLRKASGNMIDDNYTDEDKRLTGEFADDLWYSDSTINWIMNFFNITDEDLK